MEDRILLRETLSLEMVHHHWSVPPRTLLLTVMDPHEQRNPLSFNLVGPSHA